MLATRPVLAVDCEGVRLGRFGQLCLMQIYDSQFCYLIDILALGAKTASLYLGPILTSAQIIKVMHDCCEDSASIYNQLAVYPRSVFDTQLAYEMLFSEPNVSLKQMLAALLDVHHSSKSQVS